VRQRLLDVRQSPLSVVGLADVAEECAVSNRRLLHWEEAPREAPHEALYAEAAVVRPLQLLHRL
jgi:hypothetical protein